MAGYIMTLDSLESLKECVETGTYSTNLSEPKNGYWNKQQEGTFADYLSMKENDNIYFFIKRKIYGIGRLVKIDLDCKFLNYIGADNPVVPSAKSYNENLPLLHNGNKSNRCLCTFVPYPYFFIDGVDMDEALSSNPSKFRMLRALWKLSFIKIDDEENQALIDIIMKRNEDELFKQERIFSFSRKAHNKIGNIVSPHHRLTSRAILTSSSYTQGNLIRHEMAIEAALCELLIADNDSPFGKWDYISHQVVASPFKAIDYMDKMDIFGYKYIEGYNIRSKYLVIEVKKDRATVEVIEQIMKYVDWIRSEYVFGDYSMIEAYVVASEFTDEVIKRRDVECVRNFTKGYRPTVACTWNYVKLVQYSYEGAGKLKFIEV